jgi:GntR family transcriptional repressor for pyruvate dehydrogenase complex
MESPLFSELPREPTLTQRVTRQLEEKIVASRLRPGDRLPAERELARQFGVSKTVVREAITALTARSLLEPIPGGGSVIRTPSAQVVTQSMTLFLRGTNRELDYARVHEVRRTLEIEIAGLAAERRTDADLARMEAILAEMAALGEPTRARYIEDDVAFHAAIARATQNPLFALLLDSVADIMLEVRRLGGQVPGSFENGMAHHRALFDRIKNQDVTGARQAMLAHLIDSEAIMRRGQQIQKGETP